MIKQKKSTVILTIVTTFIVSGLFLAGHVRAGDLEPPGAPGSTMHSYDPACANCDGAPVEKTGQTTCYNAARNVTDCSGTGQNGEYQNGVAWPDPRFTDNEDGTVTDNLTGLIWLKDTNRFGERTWADALVDCNQLADDGVDLTDGSSIGDWRLPNVKELQSLIDFGRYSTALPSGHPFSNVQSSYYWSSTTNAGNISSAWYVTMSYGYVNSYYKTGSNYVWPVRSGN